MAGFEHEKQNSQIRGQCQGIGPVSPPPTKSYFKILGYQSTYIIKNLGYQGSQSSKSGSFSNLLAKRFVSWHFPPKFGEHIIIELESEDSRWTFCYSQGLQIRLYLTRCFRILVILQVFTFCWKNWTYILYGDNVWYWLLLRMLFAEHHHFALVWQPQAWFPLPLGGLLRDGLTYFLVFWSFYQLVENWDRITEIKLWNRHSRALRRVCFLYIFSDH